MASADTDNATETAPTDGASSPSGSGPLEKRIDELLKDVEQSLESIDPTGDLEKAAAEAARDVDADATPGTETTFDLQALSAELDGALQEAEAVVSAEQSAPAAADQAGGSTSIDELDAALADAASVADLGEHAATHSAPEPEPAPDQNAPSAEGGAPAEEVAEPAPVMPAPEPEPEPAPPVAAAPEPVSAPAPIPAPAPVVEPAASVPVPKVKRRSVVEVMLRAIASPLALMSPGVRDLIGWLGLLLAFNAVCVWVFVLVIGPQAGGSGAAANSESAPMTGVATPSAD